MIDPFDLWNSFQSTYNTFQGGWFRIQTDFIQKCNDLSKEFWNKHRKLAGKSQESRDKMLPFIKTKNFLVSQRTGYGRFNAPDDYGGFGAARVKVHKNEIFVSDLDVDKGKCSNDENWKSDVEVTEDYYNSIVEYEAELIDDIKWGAVNKHKTKGPKNNNPKIRQVDGGFEVLPRTVTVIVMDYYREPKEATFLYNVSPGNEQTGAGDNIIYDKKDSQPLEWPFNMRDEFLIELGRIYGVFTRDQFVTQVSANKQPG